MENSNTRRKARCQYYRGRRTVLESTSMQDKTGHDNSEDVDLVRKAAFKHIKGENLNKVKIVLYGKQMWPPETPPSLEPAVPRQDMLTHLPSEIMYKITSFLDDVGFVCLKNTHPRLRSSLAIDHLSINACKKYIIRGLMGLHGIPNPSTAFCSYCTMHSEYWTHYPDQNPSISAIKEWRKVNALKGVGRTSIIIRKISHICEVGTKPTEEK
ncbi:MAG: hypothetical protein Q9164_005406 [Protoblastenia rupestris]